jgi:hypothetical protein
VFDAPTRSWLRPEFVREARVYLEDSAHHRFVAFVRHHPQGLRHRFHVLEDEFLSQGVLRAGITEDPLEIHHPITTLAERLDRATEPWGGRSTRIQILRERARVVLDRMAAALGSTNSSGSTGDAPIVGSRGQHAAAGVALTVEGKLRKEKELVLHVVAEILGKPYSTISEWVRKHDAEAEKGPASRIRGVRGRDGSVLNIEPLLSMLREHEVDLGTVGPANP